MMSKLKGDNNTLENISGKSLKIKSTELKFADCYYL